MIAILSSVIAGFLLCFSSCIYTQNPPAFTSSCFDDIQTCRATLRHIAGGGIGYEKGYTSGDAFFIPDLYAWSWLPFLDLRGHLFDNGRWAANVGVGVRKIAGSRVYGLNVYYDERKIPQLNYNQVGIGAETLGKRFDVRINGYFPVGKKITDPYDAQFIGFAGHEMIISQEYQLAMRGFNAELAVHYSKSKFFDFYAAAGPYYFAGTIGPKIWGGKVRLVGRFKKYWTLELSNSYDKLFHNRFQGQLSLSIPFGLGCKVSENNATDFCDLDYILHSRAAQPVVRQEIVALEQQKICDAAIDPVTNEPYNFVFVRNTSNSAGTYESPYPTLAQAQTNSKVKDIIYVYPGDGTTRGMNNGIILKSDQKFWGSGIDHTLQTVQGTFVIPAQSSTAPSITNLDGDGITLADVNQISGINIQDVALGNGIAGSNIANIDIAKCNFDNSGLDHIYLVSSQPSAVATLHDSVFTGGNVYTVHVDSSASFASCVVKDCVFDQNINGSYMNFNGPAHLTVSGNTITNTSSVSSAPLEVVAGTDPVTVIIANNSIDNNACSALRFTLSDTNGATLIVNHNSMINNQSGSQSSLASAIVVDTGSTSSGNCQLTLTGNTIANNQAAGLYCSNGGFNTFKVRTVGNTFNDNGGGLVFNNTCNTFTLNAANNLITNSNDNGLSIIGSTINTANITITDNQISGTSNSGGGIAVDYTGTDLNLTVLNNNLSNNDGSGLIVYSSVENMTINIENNSINNNQNAGSNAASGIDVEQYVNLSGTISNNTILNNAGTGMYVGSTEPSASVCLTMVGNTSDTDYMLSNDSGVFNLAPCNVDMVNTGTINTTGVITLVQSCPAGAACA